MASKQFFSSIILLFFSSHLLAQSLTFTSLSCNAQTNPIATEQAQPLLSWTIETDGFNRNQTAYQVLVASHPDLLNEQRADFWNSKKTLSPQSAHVKYAGRQLLATQKYWWKVKIWDEKGNPSDWSPVNTFEMGLIDEANWGNAKWIALAKDTRTSEHRFREYKTGKMEEPTIVTSQPVGYFRNEWTTSKAIKSARAYVCGLGYYELYINGEKTGDHLLDPAPSNYDQQAYYVTYDITKQLISGKNAVGMIVGNGFYGQDISWKSDPESEKDLSYGVPAA
ncbi:MAG: alpha-L-rhamnosidase N-terminal domain-containing protein, partial [Saprospiraceae bacterium]